MSIFHLILRTNKHPPNYRNVLNSPVNIFSILRSFCFRSLLSFVAMETGTLSYQLLLSYLNVCVKGGHDGEVADLYEIMRARFPLLETGACSLFIQSFSRTERWREALDILNDINKVITSSGQLISTKTHSGHTKSYLCSPKKGQISLCEFGG